MALGNLGQRATSLVPEAGSTLGSEFTGPPAPVYAVEPTNWHKSLPYGFTFFNRNAKSDEIDKGTTIYLPILPSNIQVITHFATNIITTLYGIIEEHSEVRYYDITISGTTGFAPRWVDARRTGTDVSDVFSTGRGAFESTALSDDLGGFLPEVTNTISQVADVAQTAGNFLNNGPKNPTGIEPDKSGYAAFHNLYRFFLEYKQDTAGTGELGNLERSTHPIQFLNYKDGLRYDCVPQKFTMTRDSDDPMLYNYTIKLRAFNLRSIDSTPQDLILDQREKLGLAGLQGQSVFSSLSGAVGESAATLGSFL